MVNMSEPYRTLLADEIKLICEKIKDEPDINTKLFYYSAIHSAVQRIFNLNDRFDPQLVFIHTALLFSYTQILQRMNHIVAGDRLITLPTDFFDKLINYLNQLESNIRNNEDHYTALENIIVLTYITGGNGYYLYQTGKLKLP